MVERRIQDFATVDTAYDDDLLLIAPAAEDANSRETYNVTVKTLELAIQGDAHQAVEDAQNALEQTRQLAAQAKTNAESAAESKENAASSVTTIRDLYKQTSREADRAKSEADRAAAAVSTDKTLSMDGAPADAKAVGEALENLKLTPATATILGGVKVGGGLSVAADGTLSADSALAAYPVGSIYQSTDAASPAVLFGGTWEQIAENRVLMGASGAHAAATTAEAGLPNITGSMVEGVTDQGPFRTEGYLICAGAFRGVKKSNAYTGHSRHAGENYDLYFDASASNAVYGASDTVQPPAYYVHIWRRVA